MLKVLDNIVKVRGGDGAVILTARPSEAEGSIRKLLASMYGDDVADRIEIKGLGSGNPQDKADFITNKIAAEGFGDVYFTDDSQKNVDAVEKSLHDLPIIYRSQKAGAPDVGPKAGRIRKDDYFDEELGDRQREVLNLSLIHISEPTRPY